MMSEVDTRDEEGLIIMNARTIVRRYHSGGDIRKPIELTEKVLARFDEKRKNLKESKHNSIGEDE